MLLKEYTLEIFNSKCQPGAMGLHCFAHFNQDVGCALPYLNAVLGGFQYVQEPPSLTLRTQGKLIEILKLLPKTNCRKCGQPTCMVFAAQAMEGGRGAEDCPDLSPENRKKLTAYLAGFNFE